MSLEDHWRAVFNNAVNEPNDSRREDLLTMCSKATAPDRHGEALMFEINADHPRCHEIKEYFNARKISAHLVVKSGYKPALAIEDRKIAPDHMFVRPSPA